MDAITFHKAMVEAALLYMGGRGEDVMTYACIQLADSFHMENGVY